MVDPGFEHRCWDRGFRGVILKIVCKHLSMVICPVRIRQGEQKIKQGETGEISVSRRGTERRIDSHRLARFQNLRP